MSNLLRYVKIVKVCQSSDGTISMSHLLRYYFTFKVKVIKVILFKIRDFKGDKFHLSNSC